MAILQSSWFFNSSNRSNTYCLAYGAATTLVFALVLLREELRVMKDHGTSFVQSTSLISHKSHEHRFRVLAADGTPLLIDPARTLWVAGWHARFSRYYATPPPIITWTPEAEDYVEQEYRRLHFPTSCSQVKGEKQACTCMRARRFECFSMLTASVPPPPNKQAT